MSVQIAMSKVDWPRISSPVDGNDARRANAEANRRLAAMSLEAKVGQMVQAEIASLTPDDAREYALGSVLNGGGSWPNGNKRASVQDWLRLADAYHAASLASASGVPILWGTDAVHGHNNVFGATVFPHNIGLGATGDVALLEAIATATAREVRATGIGWTFAPTLAVVRDDRWGRCYEGYSEDPAIVRAFAAPMLAGLQGEAGSAGFLADDKVLATSKHFIGDGGTAGIDQGDTACSEQTLLDIHAAGHVPALAAGALTVMASFNSWNGQKVHGHRYLLTEVLKERLGFSGFVISDWNGCQQLASCPRQACVQAVHAGVDMVMVDQAWRRTIADLVDAVRAGELATARIDDAVRRILRVKALAGLFDNGPPSSRALAGSPLAPPQHRALARRAVRESLVLLKNNGAVLPLRPDLKLLVAGSHADDIGRQCGGWTLTWQGDGNANDDFPNGESILRGLQTAVAAAGGTVSYSPTGDFDERPDAAIVVFGEEPHAEGEGDLPHLGYAAIAPEPLALLRSLKAQGVPVVSVFVTSRPMWINPELNASDALVVAWLPGAEGSGVADVLLRTAAGNIRHDFKGNLSFSWPRDPWQIAINRGDTPYDPLFPYGFGLRYADGGSDLALLPEEPSKPVASGRRRSVSQGSGS